MAYGRLRSSGRSPFPIWLMGFLSSAPGSGAVGRAMYRQHSGASVCILQSIRTHSMACAILTTPRLYDQNLFPLKLQLLCIWLLVSCVLRAASSGSTTSWIGPPKKNYRTISCTRASRSEPPHAACDDSWSRLGPTVVDRSQIEYTTMKLMKIWFG